MKKLTAIILTLMSLVLVLLSATSCDLVKEIPIEDGFSAYELYELAMQNFDAKMNEKGGFSFDIDCSGEGKKEFVGVNCKDSNFSVEVKEKENGNTKETFVYFDGVLYHVDAEGKATANAAEFDGVLDFFKNSDTLSKYTVLLSIKLPEELFDGVKPNKKNEMYELDEIEFDDKTLPENVDFLAKGSKLKFLFNNDGTVKKIELKKVYINEKRCVLIGKTRRRLHLRRLNFPTLVPPLRL